jgi:hypothetical protein
MIKIKEECLDEYYDKYAFKYCMEFRPVVISTVWNSLPGYIKLQELFYNGCTYYILGPLK